MRRAIMAMVLLSGCLKEADDGGTPATVAPPPPLLDNSSLVFQDDELNDFRLTMAPADWDSIIADARGDEWRVATVQWKDLTFSQVAVRPSGEWDRQPGNPKMSLRLKFNEFIQGQRLHGLENLKFDGMNGDETMMRERLAYEVFRGVVAAPRQTHCRLFVNGEYRGLFCVEERVDKDFVKNRFGGVLGNLYRIRNTIDSYAWFGPDVAWYVPFPWEPHTHETDGDHGVVVSSLDVINHSPADAGTVCDLETLISFLAAEAVVDNKDGLAGDWGTNNHYQYYRQETGRFAIIPWDLDGAWQEFQDRSIFQNFQGSAVTRLIENDAVLRERYKARIGEILAAGAMQSALEARIDFIYAQIRDAAYEDPNKGFTNEQFDNARDWLKLFIGARTDSLRAQTVAP